MYRSTLTLEYSTKIFVILMCMNVVPFSILDFLNFALSTQIGGGGEGKWKRRVCLENKIVFSSLATVHQICLSRYLFSRLVILLLDTCHTSLKPSLAYPDKYR